MVQINQKIFKTPNFQSVSKQTQWKKFLQPNLFILSYKSGSYSCCSKNFFYPRHHQDFVLRLIIIMRFIFHLKGKYFLRYFLKIEAKMMKYKRKKKEIGKFSLNKNSLESSPQRMFLLQCTEFTKNNPMVRLMFTDHVGMGNLNK